jgi:chaperonin GroES
MLPDKAEIPTITGRIVEVSAQIERDIDFPVRKYDKVLFHPKNAIPVDFEPDNVLFVVPIEDVVAVFRKVGKTRRAKASSADDVDEVEDLPRADDDE